MRFLQRLARLARSVLIQDVARRAEINSLLLGRMLSRSVRHLESIASLDEAEFRVFSQWGEDGIIQYLLSKVAIADRSFVEFGVEDYRESNTRFLLYNDQWRGMVIDASPAHIETIRSDEIYWRFELQAVQSFVTAENIDGLIRRHGYSGDIGLLSIDVDGNDYWIWKAIQGISPRIIICEYNSLFGAERAVTIPYDAAFQRTRAHHSNLYFGASLAALCRLAEARNYAFVGSNCAGSNAFFVRRDVQGSLPTRTSREGHVCSRARESRDAAGALTFVSGADRLRLIADLPLLDIETGRMIRVRDLSSPASPN